LIEIEDDLEVKTPIPILTNLPQSVSSDSELQKVVVETSGLGSGEEAKGGRRFQVSWKKNMNGFYMINMRTRSFVKFVKRVQNQICFAFQRKKMMPLYLKDTITGNTHYIGLRNMTCRKATKKQC
jgi:hypothetical protein